MDINEARDGTDALPDAQPTVSKHWRQLLHWKHYHNSGTLYITEFEWCFICLTGWMLLSLLLGGRNSIQPVKIWVMRCWCGYLSGASCKLSAYGPADATATPSSLASLKSRMVQPFWWWLTKVVLENRLLNRSSSSSHSSSTGWLIFPTIIPYWMIVLSIVTDNNQVTSAADSNTVLCYHAYVW